ncbi:MAG TPA: hypothetical protein DIV86_01010 [Alphaproteobacteria bacterium]|mgnify:CR=1 FL=1|nr:hypothetical protein [Alphaproteobacteria bacterium]
MDITNIHSLQVLADNMRYSAARQEIISQNIASANIPEYTRKDIKPESFSVYLSDASDKMMLKTTNSDHISTATAAANKKFFDTKMPVALDMEALEMMQNNQNFNLANSTYKKFILMFKDALGSSNR